MINLSISAELECTLSLGNKVLHKIFINKYNKFERQSEKDKQINKQKKTFDKFYRKFLQDDVFDKTEYESLCNIFTKYLEETNY